MIISTGFPPKDQRGRHQNHSHQLNPEQSQMICDHIKSFKGRESHYCRNKSRRLYLPNTLNISKMFSLFTESNPNMGVSYDSFRTIFNGCFNISFGYPRADTCSRCDELISKISHCDSKLEITPSDAETFKEKTTLQTEKELHQRKAEMFYVRKMAARERAKVDKSTLAVAFDFQQELHVPNLTTNDVFYCRQLSVHSFNIHEFGGDNVYIYTYDETTGKRGFDDVASMLHHFIQTYYPDDVKHLESCTVTLAGDKTKTLPFSDFCTAKFICGTGWIRLGFHFLSEVTPTWSVTETSPSSTRTFQQNFHLSGMQSSAQPEGLKRDRHTTL